MLRLPMTLLILVALAIPVAGCVDGQPTSVFIVGNAQLDDQCVVQEDMFWTNGLIDTAFLTDYSLHLIVNNQIRSRAINTTTDPSGVHFTRAEVTIMDVTGASVVGSGAYSVPATGYVPAATDSETPGVSFVYVPAIPVSVRQQMQGLGVGAVQVGVTLFGETNGQIDVQTGEWLYDVQVCNGCRACPDDESLIGTCTPGQENEYYRTTACPPMM